MNLHSCSDPRHVIFVIWCTVCAHTSFLFFLEKKVQYMKFSASTYNENIEDMTDGRSFHQDQ